MGDNPRKRKVIVLSIAVCILYVLFAIVIMSLESREEKKLLNEDYQPPMNELYWPMPYWP